MDDRDRQQAIQLIRERWLWYRRNGKPAGVWISERPPLADQQGGSRPSTPVAAWFLDEQGLHPRSIEDWVVSTSEIQNYKPEGRLEQFRHMYEFGLAVFGPDKLDGGYSASVQWGPGASHGWSWTAEEPDTVFIQYY